MNLYEIVALAWIIGIVAVLFVIRRSISVDKAGAAESLTAAGRSIVSAARWFVRLFRR